MDKNFKFEFGHVNRKLYYKCRVWEQHKGYRGYCIVGPSGCGKTTLLKELEASLPENRYMEGFRVLEDLCKDLKYNVICRKLHIASDCECVFIDDLDLLRGKESTTHELGIMLKRDAFSSANKKRLIICTFIDEKLAEEFAYLMGYELIYMKHVKPDLRIVREKARDFSIELSEEQINNFAELDTMFKLRMAFREIRKNELRKRVEDTQMQTQTAYKLILTSRGLHTIPGKNLVKKVFEKEKLKPTSIFLMTLPEYEVDETVVRNCKELGFEEIYLAGDFEGKKVDELPQVDCLYVTEGNTFEVVEYIRKNGFDNYIKKMVFEGAVYIGSSAGAIYAASLFREAINFDTNFVGTSDFTGLGLIPHIGGVGDTVIPHYTYKQLQNYLAHMNDVDLSRYDNIYNICNEEALVMDCKKTGDMVELIKKRRIRIE